MVFDPSRAGPTPICMQFNKWMRFQIHTGVCAEHHKLKSEDDLANELNVSRSAVLCSTVFECI